MFSADLGVNQVASTPAATDPPFQKVALLLHGDGTNGAQNNTFVDSSTNNFTITRYGNTTQGTFSPFSLAEGQWSNYFDGSGDYLRAPSSSAFAFGTSDFCIEGWFYYTSASGSANLGPTLYDAGDANSAGSLWFGWYNDTLYFRIDGTSNDLTASITRPRNTWTHIAATRSGGTVRLFVNGSIVASGTRNQSVTQQYPYIGFNPNGGSSSYMEGYFSNVRVVSGSAIYTSAFTPPTSALTAVTNTSLLTCQSNRFIDNSSNNFTITPYGDTKVTAFSPFAPSAAYSASTNGGSAYFDGSGDYLQAQSSSVVDFGTGDFTIELFVLYNELVSYVTLFDSRLTTVGIQLFSSSDGTLYYDLKDASGTQIQRIATSSGTLTANNWIHIAICRSSGTTTVYVNGVSKGSTSDSYSYTSPTNRPNIGADYTGTTGLNGYISNLRVVKGTAVYTANFTPPTAPLTAVTNTQLLLNCTNAGIIDNAGKNDIETVGNAQISTSVKKYGTGSLAFDGTGDYLVNQGNIDSFIFSTGDWTIEFWLYLNSLPAANAYVLDFRPTSTQGVYPTIYITSAGNLMFFVSSGLRINASAAISAGAWQHIAICKSSGSTKAFVNGTQVGSTYTDTYSYLCGANRPSIASNGFTLNNNLLTGYIDDLRITKGQALYTSNFTPPTQAFPNV